MKNLVMGVAKGYGWQDVEPFVASCKKFCPDADLILFVDDISDFTRDKLIRTGVTLEKIPATFNDVLIIHTRWKMYADYLKVHGGDYAQVFITDTRDVIFQGDLFAPFKGYTNWLGYVTETTNIGGVFTVNYDWLVSAFGKVDADKLVDKQIICAGTIIGSAYEIKIFCRIMWDTLKGNRFWGHDQAAMNYFVWNNLLPIKNLLELDVNGGAIFTAGQFGKLYPVKIRGEKILRGNGGVPAVVHQYDRHSELVELVDNVYRDKNFSFDARFTDTRSTVEQVACLLHADKTVEAAQIFLRKFLSPADFGKSLNTLINILDTATQKNFVPPFKLIELAVQNILMNAEKLSIAQVFAVHKALMRSKGTQHAVDPQFKENIAARLLKFAKDYLDAGDTENYNLLIEMAEDLNVSSKFD